MPSAPITDNYIQIDESEHEEQEPCENLLQKKKQHVKKNAFTTEATTSRLAQEDSNELTGGTGLKRKRKGGSDERSWIWNYYEKLDTKPPYIRIVKCQVGVYNKNGLQPCGKVMNSKDYSTSNYINHLNTAHGITKEKHVAEQQITRQPQVDNMFRKIISENPERKMRLDQKFVGILIKDHQPLSIREDEGLLEFIYELDPLFKVPSEKRIREILTNGYNYTKETLIRNFHSDIISCSLTSDLWTARSRMGYIGITCAYIDKQFKLNEVILAIKYVPYPHTGKAIAKEIQNITKEWNLTNRIFTITTDNGSNMVKAAKLIPELIRIPCTAHTLQLVVGKGLLPAEVLIARAKRLMLFFTSPKQTERLLEIQKNMNRTTKEVNFLLLNCLFKINKSLIKLITNRIFKKMIITFELSLMWQLDGIRPTLLGSG